MLARDPRHRYQTVSELIVDLERSQLAAAVPSFIDPDRAMHDPVVRQRLASSMEVTAMQVQARRHAGRRRSSGTCVSATIHGHWRKAKLSDGQIITAIAGKASFPSD